MSLKLRPEGLVALLTDFGLEDIYVGVMKGRILSELPEIRPIQFIDLTHEIPPQNIRKASLKLKFSYRYFPKGTIFLVIIDPGVGTERKALVIRTEDYYFIGPDNGVFTFPIKESKELEFYEIDTIKVMRPPFSTTFHGRDLFAPAVALLLKEVPLNLWTHELPNYKPVLLDFPEPIKTTQGYLLSCLDVDRFGNIITNFPRTYAEGPIEVMINRKPVRLVKTYAEGKEGEIIALFSSEGYLEIAVKNASAHSLLKDPLIEVIIEQN
ncbi:MAG: SAM-dependent chlorinase/fluorinase [Caldimicrobium sp.]|nr:SAM-dependent chlorinase/fluorinase [Caldimicrobium sp.]MCX7874017.1 SAM-dependent chlorinase/fluorinase [Caldimicrobium sp.]MDW8094165.1 SAM-dependent chlorinase/fluorinase [Caldimicrobium sp.]